MRISGGTARGIPLQAPRGDLVRPATDGLRQAVFSSLAARISGAVFWDLFAGSGSYGLEALSRGAASGLFVEKHARPLECLRANIAAVCRSAGCAESSAGVVPADVVSWLAGGAASAPVPGLVFVDPPYEDIERLAPALFERLSERLEKAEDPVVVFELPGELVLEPAGWECVHRIGRPARRQPNAAFYRGKQAGGG